MPTLALGNRLATTRSAISELADPDAIAYVTAVEAADGQSLELPVRQAFDNFFISTKADGDYSKLNNTRILGGARTLSGALVPLKPAMTAWTNVGFVSGDYSRQLGLKGDSTTKYLNTNVLNTVEALNDHHLLTYVTEARPTVGVYAGAGGAAARQRHFGWISSTQLFVRGAADAVDTVSNAATGLMGYSRASSANYTAYRGGSNSVVTRTPLDGVGWATTVFARNTLGTIDSFSDARIIFASDGAAISTALQTRLNTLAAALAVI